MTETEITSDLLHSLGFKSFVDDNEPYFIFDGYVLQYDPLIEMWGCNDYDDVFEFWEDFLVFFSIYAGHDFIPEPPTPADQQFQLDIEDY